MPFITGIWTLSNDPLTRAKLVFVPKPWALKESTNSRGSRSNASSFRQTFARSSGSTSANLNRASTVTLGLESKRKTTHSITRSTTRPTGTVLRITVENVPDVVDPDPVPHLNKHLNKHPTTDRRSPNLLTTVARSSNRCTTTCQHS